MSGRGIRYVPRVQTDDPVDRDRCPGIVIHTRTGVHVQCYARRTPTRTWCRAHEPMTVPTAMDQLRNALRSHG